MSLPATPPPIADPWEGVSIELRFADLYPCAANWKIPPMVLDHTGLFYIWKGLCWMEQDGERLDGRPGDLFFSRPGLRVAAGHDAAHPVTVLSTGFCLHSRAGADPLRRVNLPRRLRLPLDAQRDFTVLFTELTGVFNINHPAAQLAARGQALRLLAYALQLSENLPAKCRAGQLAGRPGDAERISAVLDHIDTHIAEPLTLPGLARLAHLSPVYFVSLFRKETGRPPMAYVFDRRIELARTLLAAGDQSVEQIARAVGFEDPFHFSRAFKRKTGMPPTAYRASLKNPFQQ
jgi:AraC-like DNA-binding protein